jgi:hypothetical protein
MHGLLALEIYGHLRGLIREPATLYEQEILHIALALKSTPTLCGR